VARGSASPAQTREGIPGGQNEHGRVLRVAGKHASTPRGSGKKLGRLQWPAPKGGGAGLAGVRAPVQ
jgi:hypothetical protein